ncbi:28159_t:CDS:2 [Gigaspora margarita]|uniref:28159_t:CDS:1 n=1 Tax=Gigaspora margarita TaxID=4874 RepID=A0ABM8VW13_GIGMA|nr:28159_t:CDS:2 [Gigaspora margarita]
MDIEEESKVNFKDSIVLIIIIYCFHIMLNFHHLDYVEEDEQTKKSTGTFIYLYDGKLFHYQYLNFVFYMVETKLAKVEYDYQAKDSDELSLDQGDVVTVLEQIDKGWWKGDLNGKVGLFPANHVKLIEVPVKTDGDEEAENAENQGHLPRKLKTYGVRPGGIGSLFSGGVMSLKNKRSQSSKNDDTSALKKTSGRSASDDSESTKDDKLASPPTVVKSPIPKLPPKKRRTKQNIATVTYDYDAEEEGEISLKEGTTITILEKTDDGWWRGKNEQGETGLFPSTYVTEIKTTDVSSTTEEAESEKPAKAEEQELPLISTSPKRTKSSDVAVPEQPTSPRATSPRTTRPLSTHSQIDISVREISEESKSPATPSRRPTNSSSNRTSTHEDSLNRQSIHESIEESRQSTSESGESNATRRPPSLVSPDLPPVQLQLPRHQSKSTLPSIPTDIDKTSDTYIELTASPISPVERPVPPRPRPTSQHEAKSDSPKSPPPLAKPPTIPKPSFSPAKPPPVQRKSTRKDSKNVPGETNSETSEEQIEKIETSENQEIYDDDVSKPRDYSEKIDDGDNDDDEPCVDEKGSNEQKEPVIDSKKEIDVQQERPTRSRPPTKNIKNPSQSELLEQEVAQAKDEEPPKSQSAPPKPEKPIKPSMFKLPIAGAGVPPVALRPVAKRVVEPPTSSSEPSEPSSATSSSNTDSKPIGSVKSISNRFNLPNVPSNSDVEFRLKKWFNEEIKKVKENFEALLAEERSKREALEETVRELQEKLEE